MSHHRQECRIDVYEWRLLPPRGWWFSQTWPVESCSSNGTHTHTWSHLTLEMNGSVLIESNTEWGYTGTYITLQWLTVRMCSRGLGCTTTAGWVVILWLETLYYCSVWRGECSTHTRAHWAMPKWTHPTNDRSRHLLVHLADLWFEILKTGNPQITAEVSATKQDALTRWPKLLNWPPYKEFEIQIPAVELGKMGCNCRMDIKIQIIFCVYVRGVGKSDWKRSKSEGGSEGKRVIKRNRTEPTGSN